MYWELGIWYLCYSPVQLPKPFAGNEYNPAIDIKNSISSRGKLTISDDQICVNMDKTTGISFGKTNASTEFQQGWSLGIYCFSQCNNVSLWSVFYYPKMPTLHFNPVFGNYSFILENGQTIRLDKTALPGSDKGQITLKGIFKVADWTSFIQKLDQFRWFIGL